MAKATRVLSTPPTNTSAIHDPQSPAKPHSRRSVLGAIAAATAVGATALTLAPARAAAPAADPIYAAIERHRVCGAKHEAAWNVRGRFHDIDMNDEQERQLQILEDAIDAAWQRCEQAGIALINTTPTTPPGIVAAIRYVQIQHHNDGEHMPRGDLQAEDGTECGDWLECFLDTIADAVTDVIGRAVQS